VSIKFDGKSITGIELHVYDMDIANLFLFCAIGSDMAFTYDVDERVTA